MASVLITRPEPGASATARRLEALGHRTIVAPLFTTHSVEWTPPGEIFDALLLTSANAVRLAGPLPDRWRGLPCYAVGKATARAAMAHGFADVRAGDDNAGAIIARMRREGIGTALHLAGREHSLPDGNGPRVLTRIVYAADPVGQLDEGVIAGLASSEISHVLLYSARAARGFAQIVDGSGLRRSRIALGALSPQVADAAGGGWAAIAVAEAPDEDQLFAACGLLCEKPAMAGQQDRD